MGVKCGGATLVTVTMNFVNLFVRCVSDLFNTSVSMFGLKRCTVGVGFVVCLLNTFIYNFYMYVLGAMIGPVLGLLNNNNGGNGRLVRTNNTLGSLSNALAPLFMNTLVNSIAPRATVSSMTPLLFVTVNMFMSTFVTLSFVTVPRPRLEGTNRRGRGFSRDP